MIPCSHVLSTHKASSMPPKRGRLIFEPDDDFLDRDSPRKQGKRSAAQREHIINLNISRRKVPVEVSPTSETSVELDKKSVQVRKRKGPPSAQECLSEKSVQEIFEMKNKKHQKKVFAEMVKNAEFEKFLASNTPVSDKEVDIAEIKVDM